MEGDEGNTNTRRHGLDGIFIRRPFALAEAFAKATGAAIAEATVAAAAAALALGVFRGTVLRPVSLDESADARFQAPHSLARAEQAQPGWRQYESEPPLQIEPFLQNGRLRATSLSALPNTESRMQEWERLE